MRTTEVHAVQHHSHQDKSTIKPADLAAARQVDNEATLAALMNQT